MISIAEYRKPSYSKNVSQVKDDKVPCLICGKPIGDESTAKWVRVHNGGLSIVTEQEAANLSPSADLGHHPIGPQCCKSIPQLSQYL